MDRRLSIVFCIVALPAVAGLAYLLDCWIFVRGAYPFDGTHAWARSVSLLVISLVLLTLAIVILTKVKASRLVASFYIVAGLILTLLQPIAGSALLTSPAFIKAAMAFTGPLAGPLLNYLLHCGDISHFTFAFVAAIGLGCFLPHRLFLKSTTQ